MAPRRHGPEDTRQARLRPSLEARSVSCPILSVHLWAIGLRAGRFLFRQAAACAASGMPGSLAGALKRDAASPDQTTVRSRGATPSSDLIYLPLFLFRILDRPVVSQVRTTRTSIERELEWPAASSSRSWPPGCRDRQAASALARLPLLGPPLRPSSPPRASVRTKFGCPAYELGWILSAICPVSGAHNG